MICGVLIMCVIINKAYELFMGNSPSIDKEKDKAVEFIHKQIHAKTCHAV